MKIAIALLIPILLGIVVGSNLSPVMTVVILNQPTIALPIGVWLMMAIGLGILSSSLIQLAISIDRRRLKRQIRQLQSRLPQPDEDIFTYTSPVPETDKSATDKPVSAAPENDNPSPAKTSRFSSYRSRVRERFSSKPSAQSIISDDLDDWEAEPISNRQLEWEDPLPPPQQNSQSPNNRSTIDNEQIYPNRRTQIVENEPEPTRRQVYDADFRLIQPPYKEPLETEFEDDLVVEDFEYTEIDEDFDRSAYSVKPPSDNRSTPSKNLDEEDWGFDFDDLDRPVRSN
ncbi:LapA family protein [Chamaesiphon sp. VAR_48_metabat_135_sub]|uniref:LapA family protein n=1 Tax=Chamaesiphon sp. VAR_48_metabat_135_sub TaxID=2964699 RepID=UPI00286C0DB3|nr:LapA family protein [Chamaesiphon sp. VAR_48_metabat_135_sub]